MSQRIIECVPNFSEGRDKAVIRQITAAIEASGGVKHYSTLLSCCLRLSDAVTGIIPRLAIIWLAKPWINRNPTGLTTHP